MSNPFQGNDFVRKQFPVQAVRVTPLNIKELAEACGGTIKHDGEKEGNFSRDYIHVRVVLPLNDEQTKARIGDWLVKQNRTFKVYKDPAFRKTFEQKDGSPVEPSPNPNHKGKHNKPKPKSKPKHPSPADMPEKRAEVPVTTDNLTHDNVPQMGDDELKAAGLPQSFEQPVVEEKPKPITLDELNASAEETTPGERFRGEA